MSKSKSNNKSISPALIETILDIEENFGRRVGNAAPYQNIENPNCLRPESPLISFLCPVFVFLRWIGFTHYRYQFDENDQAFYYHSGSRPRKIMCILVQTSCIIHGIAQQQNLQAHVRSSSIYAMYKLMFIAYIIFNVSFFRAMMTKGGNFKDIFTFVQGMTNIIKKAGCEIPLQRTAKLVSIGLLTLTLTFSLFHTSIGIDGVDSTLWRGERISVVIPSIANGLIRNYLLAFTMKNVTEVDSYDVAENNSFFVITLIVILRIWLEWIGTLAWTMAFLMNTVFGLMFWKVLYNFFQLVGKSSIRNTLEDVRKFNSVTGIIDLYNVAFSWVIFSGVLTGVSHFSVFIVELFKEGVPIYMKVSIAWSFLLFGMQLLAAAQVNQQASEIVDTIKMRFQMEPVWREFHGNCIETAQGVLLIHHEVIANKIGFRGLGFFTITYSFLGTVLSVISTYAVVVMQFQQK